MRRRAVPPAVVAGLAVALALALILSPSAHAVTSVAISHPRENDVRMRVGENIVFKIALYNYGDNSVEIRMVLENNSEIMCENLEGIISVEPMSLIMSPGTEGTPTIEQITCTLAPTKTGVFAGDIGAIPVEPGTGIRIGNTMSMPIKVTVTSGNEPHNQQNPMVTLILAGAGLTCLIAFGIRTGLKYKSSMKIPLAILIILLMFIVPLAYASSEDGLGGAANVPGGGGPDTTPPTSSVNTISPYWENSSPITITATASDTGGGYVSRVALWYRSSSDNSAWDNWAIFENDNASPWLWSFNFPSGTKYYQFASTARDNGGNEESFGTADAWCAYDNSPPSAPSLLYPDNGSRTTSKEPTFSWNSVTDNGVTYKLQVDTDNSFATPTIDTDWIDETSYTPTSNLSDENYYWRVSAKDAASNIGSYSGSYKFEIYTESGGPSGGPLPENVPTPPTAPLKMGPEVYIGIWFVFMVIGGVVAVNRKIQISKFYILAGVSFALLLLAMNNMGLPRQGPEIYIAVWLTFVLIGGAVTMKRKLPMSKFYLLATVSFILLLLALQSMGLISL